MTPEAVYEQLVFLRLNDFENNMKESFIDIVQDYVLQKTPIQMMRATITFTQIKNVVLNIPLFEFIIFFDSIVSDTSVLDDGVVIQFGEIVSIKIDD